MANREPQGIQRGWQWGGPGDWQVSGRKADLLVPPPRLRSLNGEWGTTGNLGGSGEAVLGTGEQAEDGPDHRLGLGTLFVHDFMRWAFSILYLSAQRYGLEEY